MTDTHTHTHTHTFHLSPAIHTDNQHKVEGTDNLPLKVMVKYTVIIVVVGRRKKRKTVWTMTYVIYKRIYTNNG